MKTFVEVIDLWPQSSALANDIGERPDRVRKWRERNRIPAPAWLPIIQAAKRRGFKGVTAETLTQLASRL